MPEPCTVLIAAAEHLPTLKAIVGDGDEVLAFADSEPLQALAAIVKRCPRLVALERLFAATPRGAALIARIKADASLKDCEIRILSHDGAYSRVSPRRRLAAGLAKAPGLDRKGTRRVPRYRMRDRVMVFVDGEPLVLVDLSVLGAQIVSPASLRPNQRIRLTLRDDDAQTQASAKIVWASFEPPRKGTPACYRAGVEFINPEIEAIAAFCERHRA